MKTITILSGKGGVGKSSITASLAIALSRKRKIICADCDVDASNLALVFGLKSFKEWKPITTNEKAEIDYEKCNRCRKCVKACYFNAIGWDKNKPMIKEFGCEGCGLCNIICPKNAIKLYKVYNAKIGYGKTKYGFSVVAGQLEMGESGSGKIVAAVKELAKSRRENAEIMLVDAAAGIGCPVIASVSGSDYVIAVTEPTPSGFSDLNRALKMINFFNIPHGIIINKFDLNLKSTKEIEGFAKRKKIKILAKIPYDKSFTDALVNLTPIIVFNRKYEILFDGILKTINERMLIKQKIIKA